MSGLAKNYQKAIKKELHAHGAWLPVANTFKIGDYGYFEGGVFKLLGNINDKYSDIDLNVEQGPPASINFTSEGTKTIKLDANGNAIKAFAALGNAEASLKFHFSKENAIVIKAKTLTVNQLQNIEAVANILASKDNWRRKYKVISATYTGKTPLIVCSREANSEFTINAEANLLKEADLGNISAGLGHTSSTDSTTEFMGEEGVIAISLFKISWIGGRPKLLRSGSREIEIQKEFEGDLQDDF